MSIERRLFESNEIRMTKGGNTISGMAARYGSTAKLPGFHERIGKRAFDRVLATAPDVVCCLNHDANLVLGRTSSGTLQLRGDDNGLNFSCDLPNTSTARDLKESIKRGDISGMSFAFSVDDENDQEWSVEEDENRQRVNVRTIRNFGKLMDVSPCTYPAYQATSVSVRNVVAAEVRSRVERMGRVAAIAARTQPKVSAEDWKDLGDWIYQQRRNELLKRMDD